MKQGIEYRKSVRMNKRCRIGKEDLETRQKLRKLWEKVLHTTRQCRVRNARKCESTQRSDCEVHKSD